jgi:hypothetical protein
VERAGRGPVTVLLVGVGALGSRVLDGLVCSGVPVIAAGRHEHRVRTRLNLAVYSAMQLTDAVPVTSSACVDLSDVDATAETLARLRPDVIVHCATVAPYAAMAALPAAARQRLDTVGLGPWLPTHLTLADRLIRAVHEAGVDSTVVNCAYPDAVNPALAGASHLRTPDLRTPLLGAGNVANNEPAIRHAIAEEAGAPVAEVAVRMVMHHAVSHRIHRLGTAGGAPFHLSATASGTAVEVDAERLFQRLATRYRRDNGVDGRLMAAASTVAVTLAAVADRPRLLHVPGPAGLVGGYPVEVGRGHLAVVPPPGLTLAEAEEINTGAQRYDGIESIVDGTVTFTEEATDVFREVLGHECRRFAVADAGDLAEELLARVTG